jgi:hypothetical protein
MMKRYCVNISDEAAAVWFAHQAKTGLKRDPALEALLLEFGGLKPPEPVEPEYPTDYDVEVSQKGDLILVRSGLNTLLSTVKSDAANAFQVAVNAVPSGGSLGIGEGTYELPALYPVALDADGGNIFYCCIPILDRSMHIHGAGVGKTIIKLAAWQRATNRHVAMMLIRGTGPMAPGYSGFSVDGLTLDGNNKFQYAGTPHDGEALVLVGSARKGGVYRDLELRNSFGAGLYLGNNGSGSGTNELVRDCIARGCADKGIMLDTCQDSRVEDCQAWGCQEGLCLYGNDDWQERGPDRVTVAGFQTDSQVMVWQVNDFKISSLEMDGSKAASSYGLVVRDGGGVVTGSTLKSDKKKASAYGSATYLYRGAIVTFDTCDISGFCGIRAIEKAKVRANACTISASGACFAMVDSNAPMEATIIAEACKCTGKKLELQDGATFEEI